MAKRLPAGIFRPASKKKGWVSKVYHIRLVVGGKRQSFEGYSDLDNTLRLRTDLVRASERHQLGEVVANTTNELLQRHFVRLGLVRSQQRKTLDEWITDYAQSLRVAADCDDHIKRSERRLRKLIAGCGFKRLADIDSTKVANWLYGQRVKEAFGKTTSNHYAGVLRSFAKFVRSEGSDVPSLDGLKLLKNDDDIRVRRRPLTPGELELLLAATVKNRNKRSVLPADRVIVYRLAFSTGLRASELASLTPASFQLDVVPPTVTVKPTISKRRKLDVLPLTAEIAGALVDYLRRKPTDKRLWPGKWYRKAAQMLADDLAAAGIKTTDDQGRVLDFHSIRHGYVTRLSLAGVAPKLAQELARHSTINLTMQVYTHVDLAALAEAQEQASVRPFVRGGGSTGRGKARRGARAPKPK